MRGNVSDRQAFGDRNIQMCFFIHELNWTEIITLKSSNVTRIAWSNRDIHCVVGNFVQRIKAQIDASLTSISEIRWHSTDIVIANKTGIQRVLSLPHALQNMEFHSITCYRFQQPCRFDFWLRRPVLEALNFRCNNQALVYHRPTPEIQSIQFNFPAIEL